MHNVHKRKNEIFCIEYYECTHPARMKYYMTYQTPLLTYSPSQCAVLFFCLPDHTRLLCLFWLSEDCLTEWTDE